MSRLDHIDKAVRQMRQSRERKTRFDERWMGLARHISTWSEDRSRQVACVIVDRDQVLVSIGWNGFPRGVNGSIDERHERPQKYDWTKHAEENAIANAARKGNSTNGCTLYVPWYPCAGCAGDIVQAGINEIVTFEPDWNDPTYAESFKRASQILHEGGVFVRTMAGDPPRARA